MVTPNPAEPGIWEDGRKLSSLHGKVARVGIPRRPAFPKRDAGSAVLPVKDSAALIRDWSFS